MADIHHMNEEVRFAHFIEGRFEGLNEVVRQFANEADGIGEQERQILDSHFAHGGIEGSEEFVLCEHLGFGE